MLAVKLHIAIPHPVTIGKIAHSFNPTCSTLSPEQEAMLLKASPQTYFRPDGDISPDGYAFRDTQVAAEITGVYNQLSQPDKLLLLNFAKELVAHQGAPVTEPEPEVVEPEKRKGKAKKE